MITNFKKSYVYHCSERKSLIVMQDFPLEITFDCENHYQIIYSLLLNRYRHWGHNWGHPPDGCSVHRVTNIINEIDKNFGIYCLIDKLLFL